MEGSDLFEEERHRISLALHICAGKSSLLLLKTYSADQPQKTTPAVSPSDPSLAKAPPPPSTMTGLIYYTPSGGGLNVPDSQSINALLESTCRTPLPCPRYCQSTLTVPRSPPNRRRPFPPPQPRLAHPHPPGRRLLARRAGHREQRNPSAPGARYHAAGAGGAEPEGSSQPRGSDRGEEGGVEDGEGCCG